MRSHEFLRVPLSFLKFYRFKSVQIIFLDFFKVSLPSLTYRSQRETNVNKGSVETCSSPFLDFSFPCFFLRALSYSTCLSIFCLLFRRFFSEMNGLVNCRYVRRPAKIGVYKKPSYPYLNIPIADALSRQNSNSFTRFRF